MIKWLEIGLGDHPSLVPNHRFKTRFPVCTNRSPVTQVSSTGRAASIAGSVVSSNLTLVFVVIQPIKLAIFGVLSGQCGNLAVSGNRIIAKPERSSVV